MQAFLIGATGYPLLELMTRGRTHPSMALAGSVSATVLHRIARMHRPLWQKAMLGGMAITAVEALCGAVWNRDHRVWDYRRERLHWRGQVCARFTCLWCLMAGAWMCLDKERGMA